ncbi:MAG: hypothetical protein NT062_38940 [Proteobacteria bacterium]|nr:hypothetical protein [Pseudomonadota bacterium]
MRRIRITEEIKPMASASGPTVKVFKGRIDDTVHDRFVMERLAFAESRGTCVIWDIAKPAAYDDLVLASGSGTMPAQRV